MDDIERLRKEKEALLEQQHKDKEVKKLKREIFLLKNPIFIFIGNTIKITFNILANIGDAILKMFKKIATPPAKNKQNKPQQKIEYANIKPNKNKNKKTQVPQEEKKKGMVESVDDVMKNIEKEMNKFDKF